MTEKDTGIRRSQHGYVLVSEQTLIVQTLAYALSCELLERGTNSPAEEWGSYCAEEAIRRVLAMTKEETEQLLKQILDKLGTIRKNGLVVIELGEK